jgi:hypothetical protein
VPEVLDAAASVGKAAADSEEKTIEAPCSAPFFQTGRSKVNRRLPKAERIICASRRPPCE